MKDPTVVEAVAASTRLTRNLSAKLRHPFREKPRKTRRHLRRSSPLL
jgi:hypothetical protein